MSEVVIVVTGQTGPSGGGGGGGGGGSIVVQEADTTVVAAATTLDFGAGFDITESPAGEANIALDLTEYAGGALPVTAGGTGSTSAGAARTALGLVIGTDVQAQDAELSAIAGLTSAADRLPYFTGSGTAALATFTAAGRALVDDADATAQRTTLGLGGAATLNVGTTTGTVAAGDDSRIVGAVQTSRTISTTAPLSGGGDLSANRTLSVSAASDAASGVVELATTAETTTGTDATRAVTPAGLLNATTASNINARVAVENNGTLVGTRRTLNFIPGTNVTLTITDDPANEEVDVTIAATGGGGAGLPHLLPGAGVTIVGLPGWAATATTPASSTLTVDTMFAVPFFVTTAITLTNFHLQVNTTGGNNIRVMLYSGAPGSGSLVATLGTVSSATTGLKSAAISQALTAGTEYWVALHSDGSPVVRVQPSVSPIRGNAYTASLMVDYINQYSATAAYASGAPATLPSLNAGATSGATTLIPVLFTWS